MYDWHAMVMEGLYHMKVMLREDIHNFMHLLDDILSLHCICVNYTLLFPCIAFMLTLHYFPLHCFCHNFILFPQSPFFQIPVKEIFNLRRTWNQEKPSVLNEQDCICKCSSIT